MTLDLGENLGVSGIGADLAGKSSLTAWLQAVGAAPPTRRLRRRPPSPVQLTPSIDPDGSGSHSSRRAELAESGVKGM
jgi:hypothetical protein